MPVPFFSLRFSEASRPRCPAVLEVPSSGFGYPLDGVRFVHPWKPLSAPHALGLRPSKLFSNPGIENKFPCFPSALALFPKPCSASDRRLSGFLPPDQPCLSLPPEGLVRAETSCSLGLSDLSGSPSKTPRNQVSLFVPSLCVLGPQNSHKSRFPKP